MHLIGRHLRQNERLIKDRIRQLNFHLLIKIKLLLGVILFEFLAFVI